MFFSAERCLGIVPQSLPRARVERIVDGDTLRVHFAGKSLLVRMIGIDTPERVENDKARRDARRSNQSIGTILTLGEKASQHLASIVPIGSELHVEMDVEHHDRYGRLLAYLYTPAGALLNESMLRDGYAQLMTIPPNLRHLSRLQQAQSDARINRRGLWADEEGAVLLR